MKILYHSAPPMADTGYGCHTRELVSRLREDHEVVIHSVGGFEGMGIDWNGIDVLPAGAGKHGEQSIPYWYDETNADVVFSHHDHWAMADTLSGIQQSGIPMVLYTILDHGLPGGRPPEAVVQANEDALRSVVISEWAERRTQQSRIPQEQVRQIPHGIDTAKYAPVIDHISDAELKRELGVPEDAFVFGMVAANYGPRKNIPSHIEAFRRILDDHDDVYFYIHTHPQMSGGYDLQQIRDDLDIPRDRLLLPDGHEMAHGIDDLTLVQLYNTFDVHLNCSQSEGWGLTVTEAMSCGTPVIASNNSAMTEQFGCDPDAVFDADKGFTVTDHGVLVNRGNEMWTQNASARRFIPSVDDIEAAMRFYYNRPDRIAEHGAAAREYVVENYDWDALYEDVWRPLFAEVEEALDGEEYDEYYFKRREAETQSQAFQTEAQRISMNVRGESVLDVGCGTGTLLEHLQSEGYDVQGVEYAEAGVEKCTDKELPVRQGDIRDLQFKDDSFDTVVSQHVVEHVEADAAALAELSRVARQRVVVVVPGTRPGSVGESLPDATEERRYDAPELDRLVEEFTALTDRSADAVSYDSLRIGESRNWLVTVAVTDDAEAETDDAETAEADPA